MRGDASGLNRISLPYDDNFVLHTLREVDRFVFTPLAGMHYQVRVSRAVGTTVTGEVRITQGAGATLALAAFGASAFAPLVQAVGTEDISIDVTAGLGSPGAYRIEVLALPTTASCVGAEALTLPMSPRNLSMAANSTLCFTVALAANEALLIEGQAIGTGTFTGTLKSATDAPLASKTLPAATNGMFAMRAAVVQPGIYGVEFVTRAGTGPKNFQGFALSRIALDGILDLPSQRAIVRAQGDGRSFWYVARPASAGAAMAVTLNDETSEHAFKVWPSEAFANNLVTGRTIGRVVLPDARTREFSSPFELAQFLSRAGWIPPDATPAASGLR